MRLMIVVVTLVLAGCALAGSRIVAGNGQTPAVILPADATALEQYAAAEFAAYVEKITGIRPAVGAPRTGRGDLVIGRAPAALGVDAFRLHCAADGVHVDGVARGALFGVYELLERFGGCGWFASWCEVVPRAKTFGVPDDLDVTEKPAFEMREPFWGDLNEHWDFAAKLKCNNHSWCNVPPQYGGNEIVFGLPLGTCHTFFELLPPDRYFKEHPEYYSLIDGRRMGAHAQLCLTNPDVLRIATEKVLEVAAKRSEAKVFGVSQNDWANYCTCSNCQAVAAREGSESGVVIEFVNRIAEALEAKHPGKYVETLAYQYTRKPPKSVRPRHNVMICLCSIECEFRCPLTRSPFAANKSFLADFKGWSALTPNIFIWDYTTDFDHYLMPLPNVFTLQENVKFFRDGGVRWLFEQGAHGNSYHADFGELKAWLLAKWMWNPEADRETLLKTFLDGYYGAGAPYVREYLDQLQGAIAETNALKHLIRPFTPIDAVVGVYDETFLNRGRKLWRQAEKAVRGDPVRLYNVRMGMMPLDYMDFMVNAKRVRLMRDEKAFEKIGRHAAKRLMSRIREAEKAGRPVHFCEDIRGKSACTRARLEAIADGTAFVGDGEKVTFEEDALMRIGPGDCTEIRDDAQASGGKAEYIANNNFDWFTTYALNEVAFDDDEYVIRVRMRAERTSKEGEVVRIGLWDSLKRKETARKFTAKDFTSDDYAWYDVITWRPGKCQQIFIAGGWFDKKATLKSPAHNGVWIDQFEIRRAKSEK